jgi:hypothetical protein
MIRIVGSMLQGLRQLWRRVTRVLAARRSRGYARREVDGIELLLLGTRRLPEADRVFEQATRALREIAAGAPEAYAAVRRHAVRLLFPERDHGYLYHPFQMAIVVPPYLALEPDVRRYAAWILAALDEAGHGAQARYGEQLLASWAEAERVTVAEWVGAMKARTRQARASGRGWEEEEEGLRSGGGGGGGRVW